MVENNSFLKDTDFTEQMKMISSNLIAEQQLHRLKKVMITSPMTGDGKNTISNGLAKELTKFGQKVVLVNANLRDNNNNPLLPNEDKYNQDIATFLEGDIALEQINSIIYASSIDNLFIVPSFATHSNASDLLLVPNMRRLLEYLELNYDFVLVNGPAMVPNSDGVILTNVIQNLVLITRLNFTKREMVDTTMALLKKSKANVIGIINNEVSKL